MASRWLERLYRGNKLAVISGALLLAAFLVLNFVFLGHHSTADASGPLPASPQHTQHPRPQSSTLRTTSHELESYCSPEFTSSAVKEGSVMDPTLRLTNVLLLTRHGDRTPIHTVENSVFAPHKEYYAPSAFKYKRHLAKFRLSALGDTQKEEALHSALDPHAIFSTPDHKLAPGTLTSWGFMQHVELGKALARAYQKFIMALDIEKEIYIRSTHYERTIQSAAGLMIGLLGHDLAAVKTRLPVQVFLWDAMEFMHGSGLRDTSKAKDESTRWIEGSCAKAVEYSAKQHEAIQPRKAVMEQLASLFGEGVRSRKVTELTDAIMPAYCHGEPLPCSRNGCVNIELLKEMKRESDRVYCKRYWGAEGGLNATKLSHYQLMSEIATRMRESATGKSHIKLSLLSGHDTVIAPVLASLGVSSCEWPPYASRLTFETWTTAREGAPTKLDNTYARVLYNGKAVTMSIPGCVVASNRDPKLANMRPKSKLCPLPILLNHISGLLQPYPDLHTACTNA